MSEANLQIGFTFDRFSGNVIFSNGFTNNSDMLPKHVHSHPFYEIQLIERGEYKIQTAAGTLYPNEGNLLIVPPEFAHCCIPAVSEHPSIRRSFWLDIHDFEQACKKSGLLKVLRAQDGVLDLHIPNAGRIVEDIRVELVNGGPYHEIYIQNLVISLLIEISRSLQGSAQGGKNNVSNRSVIVAIEDYIERNYEGKCSLEGLSDELNLSQRQLSRLIRDKYARSFRRMLLEKRMSTANWYLEESDMPLLEVAQRAGYTTLSSFYHAYVAFYNATPVEHRQRFQLKQ